MTQKNDMSESLTLEIPASFTDIDIAAELFSKAIGGAFAGKDHFGLLLGFREAMTNAAIHGNGLDEKKSICCKIDLNCDRLTIEIIDCGNGFDWKRKTDLFPDPTIEGSRGISIMKWYFDECNYNEKGNKLLLTKRRL